MHSLKLKASLAGFVLLISSGMVAQSNSPDTVPVTVIASVEAKHGKEVPTINKEDVRPFYGHDRVPVAEWKPLQGDQSGLELFKLVDDASDPSVGGQLDDLRKFMEAQPPTTAIGVAYLRDGGMDLRQNLTTDHALAAKALRIPMGLAGGGSSPYLSLTELIKRWPASKNRHEVFMVSPGIDWLQPGPTDSYLQDTIEQAQRAGVQVYSIYTPHVGHFGHSFWRSNLAQSNLSQLADETGGEAYYQGFQAPISFAPYLDQFANRLMHQYRLTLMMKAENKPAFRHVKIETEVPNAEIVIADHIYVPAR